MRRVGLVAAFALFVGPLAGRAWSQHEGHGGMGGMGGVPMSDPAAAAKAEAQGRMRKLEKLQDKIQALEDQLEGANLPAKKRISLEKKLKKLYEKKDRLLAEGRGESPSARPAATPAVKKRAAETACAQGADCGGAAQAVYTCSMGDYSGPMTKDGRCPKCGMNLQKQEQEKPDSSGHHHH